MMQTAVGTPLRTVALHTVTAIVTVGVALSLAIIPHVPTRAQAWTATTQHQCWIHGALLALHFVACAASQALHRWHRAKGYLALGRRTIDALPLPLILVASAHAALSVVWTWSSASNEETSSQMMLMGTLEIVRLVVLGAEAVAVSLVALRSAVVVGGHNCGRVPPPDIHTFHEYYSSSAAERGSSLGGYAGGGGLRQRDHSLSLAELGRDSDLGGWRADSGASVHPERQVSTSAAERSRLLLTQAEMIAHLQQRNDDLSNLVVKAGSESSAGNSARRGSSDSDGLLSASYTYGAGGSGVRGQRSGSASSVGSVGGSRIRSRSVRLSRDGIAEASAAKRKITELEALLADEKERGRILERRCDEMREAEESVAARDEVSSSLLFFISIVSLNISLI